MNDNAPAKRFRVACLGFVFDPFAQAVMDRIAPESFELSYAERPEEMTEAMLTESDMLLVVAPVSDEMMAKARHVRFIQKWGTGYEKIDVAAAARHGITVAITAGANANTIAEHAVTLMLAAMRRIVVADRALREGRWIPSELRPVSQRLYGKTVGIIGFGNIGKAVARLLSGFGCKVLYYKRGGPVADEAALGARYAGLDELYAGSDVVTLHCPGGAATRGMIDKAAIAKMKPGAVLINVSRGELVVEDDLVEALRSGRLSAAGLDVFAEEPLRPGSALRSLDNAVLTPHSAGSLVDDIAIMAGHSFENMLAFQRGERIRAADLIVDPDAPRQPLPERTAKP
ncbi:dehydrogenase [Bosea caraganae]|uniref:Dehydrogenase n=1 Tax=Bosea caraganae TaxID=2763117 RepID=A0A370LAC8_9HYPH|nr:2-hydroxyacid dehydrogenase [Bosea caraganae]RDJ21694.1 dehydrogenase [Bosea caraganae]RDJ28275.1 dehydrogenase [Bosea caraganae]